MNDSLPEDVALETPPNDVFIAPSIYHEALVAGSSYTHHTAIPDAIANDMDTECALGIDEAGRGPTLGNSLSFHRSDPPDIDHLQGQWSTDSSISPSHSTPPSSPRRTTLMIPKSLHPKFALPS